MKNNQRGGIISKIFLFPVAVALMAGFFMLGYYVGKYQNKSGGLSETAPPLPEIVSKSLPKPDEFTFYKTLTDKYDKTVSIDLKPKSVEEEKRVEKKSPDGETAREKGAQKPGTDKKTEDKADHDKTASGQAVLKQQAPAKKESASAQKSNPRLRYTLQLASYQEKEPAEEDIKKMKQRGYAAFIVASELPGKGTWYRVRLGSFLNKTAAEKLQKDIQAKEGISSFITIE
jgi:DedD protein